MILRLPVPIFNKDKIYRFVEIQKPKASVLADTKKVADGTGDLFSAMKTYLFGSIVSIKSDDNEITDPIAIKSLLPKIPFISANYLCMQIAISLDPDDDGIEGFYPCPRCGTKVISEFYDRDGVTYDTRDFIKDLKVTYLESDDNEEIFDLEEEIQVVDATGALISTVSSFTMRFPTLEDSIMAFQKYGRHDEVRLQFAQYAEALTQIDCENVDPKWKRSYGVKMFEDDRNVKRNTDKISSWLKKYGLQNQVGKSCPNCGKVWQPYINTSNFFASGLQ